MVSIKTSFCGEVRFEIRLSNTTLSVVFEPNSKSHLSGEWCLHYSDISILSTCFFTGFFFTITKKHQFLFNISPSSSNYGTQLGKNDFAVWPPPSSGGMSETFFFIIVLTSPLYRDAMGFLLVFDVTNDQSLLATRYSYHLNKEVTFTFQGLARSTNNTCLHSCSRYCALWE